MTCTILLYANVKQDLIHAILLNVSVKQDCNYCFIRISANKKIEIRNPNRQIHLFISPHIKMDDPTHLILPDLDQTILDNLIPPSIMAMVRVNRHYNRLLKPKQDIFNEFKMNFADACIAGHYWLAKWIYDTHEQGGACMMWSMCNGNRHYTYGADATIQVNKHHIFHRICDNGHLQTAKLFRQLEKYVGQIKIPDISNICFAGHFELAQWLIECKTNNYIYTSAINNACIRGHLDIAKWLIKKYEEYKIKIDIHWDKERLLRFTLKNGHFNVAKWLIELGENGYGKFDIHANDNEIFRFTLKFEIIEWLDELRDRGY